MPLVACPKCTTNLRVPDGAAGAVRCPKCQTVFQPPKPAQPAFEVVDDLPPPKPVPKPPTKPAAALPTAPPGPKPGTRPAAPLPPKPGTRPATSLPPKQPAAADDFEVVDATPTKTKIKAFSRGDEDDRARSRGRRDDDADDDRPSARRRSREDDYDDDYDDDPPRRRRGGRDDYDRPADRRAPFRRAKVASLLLAISLWLYMGAFGLMTLLILLLWADANVLNLFVIPGLVGLANWIVALVGLGFMIAGPPKVRGLAIATAVVAGLHLILTMVCFSKVSDQLGVLGSVSSGFGWFLFTSMLWAVDAALPALIYASKSPGGSGGSGESVIVVLAGGLEVARIILLLLTLKAVSAAARDYDAADRARLGVMITSIVMGAAAALVLIGTVIVVEGKMFRSARHVAGAIVLLVYLGYTLMLIVPALAAMGAKDACDRRG